MSDDRERHNAYHREYQRRQRRAAGIPERTKAQCGDRNGYLQHRRDGTEPCAACRAAWAAYQRERYRLRKAL